MHTRTSTQHKGTQSFVSKVQTRRCMQAAKSASPVLAPFFFGHRTIFFSDSHVRVCFVCTTEKGDREESGRSESGRVSQLTGLFLCPITPGNKSYRRGNWLLYR